MSYFFGTKSDRAVSVERGMNAKMTSKVLNTAFKQFQRLPDWPPIKTHEERRLSDARGEQKSQAAPQWRELAKDASVSRTLVEYRSLCPLPASAGFRES